MPVIISDNKKTTGLPETGKPNENREVDDDEDE